MSQHTPDGRAIVAALGKLTAQVKRVADAKRSDFALTPDAPAVHVTPEMQHAAERTWQAAVDSGQAEVWMTAPRRPLLDDAESLCAEATAAIARRPDTNMQRVIDLYEQWVKAGPPPLGASMARWWDARLVELHEAIRPTVGQAGCRCHNGDELCSGCRRCPDICRGCGGPEYQTDGQTKEK